MNQPKAPMTQAVHALRRAKVAFNDHPYTYLKGGGTAQFAREMGVERQPGLHHFYAHGRHVAHSAAGITGVFSGPRRAWAKRRR